MSSIAPQRGFLPLLPNVTEQRQKECVPTEESDALHARRILNENRPDRGTDGQAKEHTFIPLLPHHHTNCPKQKLPRFGPSTVSVSSKSPPEIALSTTWPSHEARERIAEAAAREDNVLLPRPKVVRRYEWPLIVNGVYQGKGLLPSCRVEDNEPSADSRPYAWPLIILHRARFDEDCDQQPGARGKEVNETTAGVEEKGEEANEHERSSDESRTTDGISAEC